MNPIVIADYHDRLPRPRQAMTTATVALGAWFLVALSGSLAGVFDSSRGVPLAIGLAASMPVLVFAICWTRLEAFRSFANSLESKILLWTQTWRVGGLVFLVLHNRGLLPDAFALPAGWGDIAIGATAPLVALAMNRLPRKLLVAWNVLGIADLMMAVALGILSSAGPLGVLAGPVTTRPMGLFPLSLIPTFAVPLLTIFHLIVLGRLRSAGEHGATGPRSK